MLTKVNCNTLASSSHISSRLLDSNGRHTRLLDLELTNSRLVPLKSPTTREGVNALAMEGMKGQVLELLLFI